MLTMLESVKDMEVAKILVVDDEPSILKLLKEALTQWGYHVGCVGTGTEALEAIRTELYDAAITSGLSEVFLEDLSQAREVSAGARDDLSLARRLAEGAARVLSPLL